MQGMATPAGNQVLFSTKFSGVLAAELHKPLDEDVALAVD